MGQHTGSPQLYIAASTPEPRNPKLARDAAARLEESRLMLMESGHTETVQLLDMVLLQLRMEMRGVSEMELKELCAALSSRDEDNLRDADSVCVPLA